MKNQLLGVIDATAYYENLGDLIEHRSLAALPFAGRYRLIDFMLSNMVHSGIRSVAIFPMGQYRSLMDHLESGKNWDLNRKRDGLFFFPNPYIDRDMENMGSFQRFAANLAFFQRSTQEYSLIANCHTVLNMDIKPLLTNHIESGCDITEVRNDRGASLGIFLLKTSLLIHLIETTDDTGYTSMPDVVHDCNHSYAICHYHYGDYALIVDSLQTYYRASLNLLKPEIWRHVFEENRPILTKVKDEPPSRYMHGSAVQNSLVANGCIIKGQVERSIISREVIIGNGSIIKNSIIMQKCQIGDNCYLDSVILDKDVKIAGETTITGTAHVPYVIRKGTVQGALMNS